MNGAVLAYSNREHCVCSAIEHDGSYGRNDDLIEIMGLLTDEEEEYDSVCGYLSAQNVYERIMKHYQLGSMG